MRVMVSAATARTSSAELATGRFGDDTRKEDGSTAQPTHRNEPSGAIGGGESVEGQLRRQCDDSGIEYIEPGAPPYQVELQMKKKKKQAEAAREKRRGALRKAIARERVKAGSGPVALARPAAACPKPSSTAADIPADAARPAAARPDADLADTAAATRADTNAATYEATAAAAVSQTDQPDATATRLPLVQLPQQSAVEAAPPQACAYSKPRGHAPLGMDGTPCKWDAVSGGWRHSNQLWYAGNRKPEPLATATEALVRARTNGFVFGTGGGGSFAPVGSERAFSGSASGGLSFGGIAVSSGHSFEQSAIAGGSAAPATVRSFSPTAREPAVILRNGPTFVSGFTFNELSGFNGGGSGGPHHKRPRGRAPIGTDGQTQEWDEESGSWRRAAPPPTVSICSRPPARPPPTHPLLVKIEVEREARQRRAEAEKAVRKEARERQHRENEREYGYDVAALMRSGR